MLKKLIDEPQWVPLIAELKFQHYRSIAKNKTLDDFRKGVERDLRKNEAFTTCILYTHERAAWHQKQGWTFYGTASLHETPITILLKQLSYTKPHK